MSVNYATGPGPGLESTFVINGKTEKGPTPRRGWTMLREGKWFEAAKSYGITASVIVSAVAVLSLMAGVIAGLKLERSRNDSFLMNGTRFIMVGISEIPGAPEHYMPIYKTEVQASKDYAEGRFK